MEWRAFRFSFSVLLPHIHRLSLQPHSDQTLYLSCYFSRSGIFHQHGNIFIIVPDIGLDRLPENRPVKLCLIFQAVTDHPFLIINLKRQSILLNRCGTKFQSFRLCIVWDYFRIIHLKPRLGCIFIKHHNQCHQMRQAPLWQGSWFCGHFCPCFVVKCCGCRSRIFWRAFPAHPRRKSPATDSISSSGTRTRAAPPEARLREARGCYLGFRPFVCSIPDYADDDFTTM